MRQLLKLSDLLLVPNAPLIRRILRLTVVPSYLHQQRPLGKYSAMAELSTVSRKYLNTETGPRAEPRAEPVPRTEGEGRLAEGEAPGDGVGSVSDNSGRVAAEAESGGGGTEEVPAMEVTDGKNKLSRRAMKRIMRAKRRESAMGAPSAKRRKNYENRELNFTDEHLNDAEYYIENGLRKVYPYSFNFTTYAKGRWVGEKILDIFAKEFKAYHVSTYEKAIKAGRVTVNSKRVSTDYILKDNDYIQNVVHRHELAVTADKLRVVTESDDVVVIDKPSSIPVHPCGRYRHNSLTYIMGKELGLRNLRTIYRLDRLTSGVFIFCKTDKQTQRMQSDIRNRRVEKTYVARVVGQFPSEPQECTSPIDTLSHKMGLFKVGPHGKEAKTSFERLSFDGETSVVSCKPHTGRTHQIRIHLQYLGFPIVNDPLYNSPAWGPLRGKGGDFGKSEEELVEELIRHHSAERFEVNPTSKSKHSSEPASDSAMEQPARTDEDGNLDNDHHDISDVPTCVTKGDNLDSDRHDTGDVSTCVTKEDNLDNDRHDIGDVSTCVTKEDNLDSDRHDTGDVPTCVTKEDNLDNDRHDISDVPTCVTKGDNLDNDRHDTGDAPAREADDDRPRFDQSKLKVDPLCEECTRTYIDPKPADLVMYLHALSYSGPGWKFETDLPDWAKEDWTPTSVRTQLEL